MIKYRTRLVIGNVLETFLAEIIYIFKGVK